MTPDTMIPVTKAGARFALLRMQTSRGSGRAERDGDIARNRLCVLCGPYYPGEQNGERACAS